MWLHLPVLTCKDWFNRSIYLSYPDKDSILLSSLCLEYIHGKVIFLCILAADPRSHLPECFAIKQMKRMFGIERCSAPRNLIYPS